RCWRRAQATSRWSMPMHSPGSRAASSTRSASAPRPTSCRSASSAGCAPAAACSSCAATRRPWRPCSCTPTSTATALNRCSKPNSPISPAPCRRLHLRSDHRLTAGPDQGPPLMIRRPLALALLLALLPAAASAEDLLQTYELARGSDPQLAISEANRDISREGRVQARASLLPQINGSASINRSYAAGVDGDARRRSVGVDLSQTVFDLGAISNLRAQRDLDAAAGLDLEAANDELITRTS